jgi:DNA-binding transcriptional LysR family regulator
MEFDNIETIKQAIMIAAGVSLLPRHTVEKETGVRTLALVPFSIPELVRPVGIIHRRQKPLTPVVGRFIQLLKESNGGEAAAPAGPERSSPSGRASGGSPTLVDV